MKDEARRAHQWDWTAMDARQAYDAWTELSSWVAWLVGRFDLADEIPPCWWAHPAIVEELTGLWAAWVGAYRHPKARGDKPLAWLGELEKSRSRIKTWDRAGCARGRHRQGAGAPWAVDDAGFDRHVLSDLSHRPSPPDPPGCGESPPPLAVGG